MGGDATAVSDETRNIYIEAAFWWPESIQGRSRRFNFSTDAGHRYERGVDPSLTVEHIERITQLVLEICGGEAGPIDDQTVALPDRTPVALRASRAARVIGMPLSAEDCIGALQRLGLEVSRDGDRLSVVPPPHRFDLAIEEDLIEEVVRVIGYDKLPTDAPLGPITGRPADESHRSRFTVRRLMAALGYQETINFSFVEEGWERDLAGNADPVKLLNPIASQMSVMRSSLLGSLMQVLRHNLDRKADRVRVFEIGRVFMRNAAVATTDSTVRGVRQPMKLAGLAFGPVDGVHWGRKGQWGADFFDAKGDVEALLSPLGAQYRPVAHPALHPGRCAGIFFGEEQIGVVGELHPRWRQAWDLPIAPMLFELDLEAILIRQVPAFQPVPKVQPAERDIAVVVADAVSLDSVLGAARSADTGGLLQTVALFDLYKPQQPVSGMSAGEKSMALRLTLGNSTSTLTDDQIDAAVRAVVDAIGHQASGRLRG
jgi:phenylalanyl-tRNA synthetase beta chain